MQLTGIYSQQIGILPPAPSFVSAEVLANGYYVRVHFDYPIVSGFPDVGFLVTGTTLENNLSVLGPTYVDLRIRPVTNVEAVTVQYTLDGDLAGVGGTVLPFGPSLATNGSTHTNTWATTGNLTTFPSGTSAAARFGAAAKNSTDFALTCDPSDDLKLIRYTAPNWNAIGSTFNFPSAILMNAVAYLSGDEYAVLQGVSGAVELQAYTHNGSTFSPVGNALPFAWSAGGWVAMARLDTNLFVLAESSTQDVLQVYQWDGLDFTAVGSPFSIAGRNGITQITALSPTQFALVDSSSNTLDLYNFDGSNIILEPGSSLSIDATLGVSSQYPSVAALNPTDVVISAEEGKIQTMRWNGSWSTVGSAFTLPSPPSGAGSATIISMGNYEVAFMRASTSNSFLRRLVWQ